MTYSGFSPIGALHRRPIVRTLTPPLLPFTGISRTTIYRNVFITTGQKLQWV